MMNFEEYVPFPKQVEFHNHLAMYKLYGGSMGGAKSTALAAEAIRLSLEFPGNAGYLCRKTYRDFKRTTLLSLNEMLPPKIVKSYNKVDGEIVLINNSVIYLGDLEYPDKIKSMNLGWYGIDEASETTEEIFHMLNTRLRRNVPNIRYYGLLASNPEPGWLKDRFVDPQLNGTPHPDHVFIQSLTRDNPYLPKGYVERLTASLPPAWRARYIDGSWDVFDKQIFDPLWIKPSEEIGEIVFKVCAVDPAISEKETADDSVISTFGVDKMGIAHELETVAGKWSFNTLVDQCLAVYNRQKPDFFGVEYVAFQKALGDVLNSKGVPVTELRADGDKVRRALSVSHFFEQGLVRINNKKMQRQLIDFPQGEHDDYVDGCCYSLILIKMYGEIGKQIVHEDKYKGLDAASILFWKEHYGELDYPSNHAIIDL